MRKAILVVSAVALWGSVASGQISLVNVTQCGSGAFPGTICTIPSAGAGHLLVIGWQAGSGATTSTTISTITDNIGNTYQEATSARAIDAAAGSVVDMWYSITQAAGATSITITPSVAVSSAGVAIWEFAGVAASAPLDQAAALNSQPSSTTVSAPPVTTTSASDVVISLAAVSGNVTGIAPGNSFINDVTLKGNGWAYSVTSGPGAYAAQWNQSPSGTYASSTASFRAAGSISACDLNADGTVNIVDVQLATDMDLGTTTCAAPAGFCSAVFVQDVLNAVLGQPCVLVALSASPSTINFGNVTVNGTATQSVKLTAIGTGTATISQVTVTPSIFGTSGLSLPLSLPAGQSASFNVTFAPTATGSASGNLAIISNALESPVNVPFTGSGVTVTAHSASLSWTASTSPNIAGYNVYRITSSNSTAPNPPYTKLNASLVSAVTYQDTTVQAGTSYYYYTTAVDTSNNESAPSNIVQAVIPSP